MGRRAVRVESVLLLSLIHLYFARFRLMTAVEAARLSCPPDTPSQIVLKTALKLDLVRVDSVQYACLTRP